ncbi:lytic murein transglycosylase [Aliihoeflea aestuarii]|uniref:lytic murein transglycosylase n=1 Tax=Aliihoeflea aestuarii TaxID=453840 RepID=UPI00209202E0|nr:lytic murein transglycosylase [Aliihoeflea aestuarii]MCO6391933.1 lytic murein transglycosylase [Aliihoeflea aestuarii]
MSLKTLLGSFRLGARSALAALAAAGIAIGLSVASTPAFADAGFQRWVQQFRSTAAQSGISGSTFDRAFQGVTAPDPEVLERARYQPEFVAPVWDYFDNRVNDNSVGVGRQMLRQHDRLLGQIEQRLGVDRHILLAIWSMESNYGEVLKNDRVMRNVVRSLSTLAYADERRQRFGRQQLIAALKILERGDIDVRHLTGSWAGAMGHTQFIPTSYQEWAVDFDGDGRRDIWNSIPDALASAANLLRANGWRSGHAWGYEVRLPEGRKFPAGTMSLAEWQRIGVVRTNGQGYPRPNDRAELKVLDGREGPAFLVLHNFNMLKRYNNADRYALAVGLLADQIAGQGQLARDWNRPFTRLSFNETQELQQHLLTRGYYDGNIDGKIGPASRDAIKAFQSRMGMQADGHPSKEVLTRIRGQ